MAKEKACQNQQEIRKEIQAMKLKYDRTMTLHLGRERRVVDMKAGQGLLHAYLYGDPIILLVGGEWDGWYFVACNKWVSDNMEM
jgi:hypothetical protein